MAKEKEYDTNTFKTLFERLDMMTKMYFQFNIDFTREKNMET